MRRLGEFGLQFLLALVLALALWTFVSFSRNPSLQRELSVPVRVIAPPDELIMVDPDTGLPISPTITTTVEISGPQSEVNGVAPTRFSATLDASQLEAGAHRVPIEVSGPRNVRIRSHTPEELELILSARAERELPVEVVPSGQLPFLLQSKPLTTTVERVLASGPTDLLARVASVVAPVELQGRTTSFSAQQTLQALDQQGNPVAGVTLEPSETTVVVIIESRVDVQRVSVVPQIIGQPGPGYRSDRIDWNPKYVDVIASYDVTATLTTSAIDLTGRTEGFTTTVDLNVSDSTITVLTPGPIAVTVPIVPFEIPYNSSLFVQVIQTNLGPNLQATTQPLGLTINVSGTAQQFNQLANTTVQAVVDLSGRGPGSYALPVQVELPPGLQLVGDPPEVTVTISPVAAPTPTAQPEGG